MASAYNERIIKMGYIQSDGSGRRSIVITNEMTGDDGVIFCNSSRTDEGVLTELHPGDLFVVEDEDNAIGYRISYENLMIGNY